MTHPEFPQEQETTVKPRIIRLTEMLKETILPQVAHKPDEGSRVSDANEGELK